MPRTIYDVIIIGAGPAGAACAKRCVEGGLKTLILEKYRLPRKKACSGIIAHGAWRFIRDNFGEIPDEVCCRPKRIIGTKCHFIHAPPITINMATPIPYIWRDVFDKWLIDLSGAALRDRHVFLGCEDNGTLVEVKAELNKREVGFRTRYLVGADGGYSSVVRSINKDAHSGIPWGIAYQKYYDGKIELEENYFHIFYGGDFGLYPWCNIKDGRIIIGCCCLRGERISTYYRPFVQHLKDRYGLVIKKELDAEGCQANFMAPFNRFYLGQGRVLVVGEAAGFLHAGGEGISCALKTGALAGEAIVDALKYGRDALKDYSTLSRKEREIALDQFNPLRMARSSEIRIDEKGIFEGVGLLSRLRMLKDIFGCGYAARGKGIYTSMFKNMLRRMVLGDYRL